MAQSLSLTNAADEAMKTNSHTLAVQINVGGPDIEIMAQIDFTIIPGNPATGPTYSCGGQPADPAEIEIHSIELVVPNFNASYKDGKPQTTTAPCPDWLAGMIRGSDEVYGALGDSADWGAPYRDPDAAYDAKRDEEISGW